MDFTEILKTVLSNNNSIIGGVSLLLIFAGISALGKLKPDSPLSPYVLQILGLTFILPVVLLVTLTLKVSSEAIMGLLGTIVGYIFGTSRISEQRIGQSQPIQSIEESTSRTTQSGQTTQE